ncbi:MAG: N-acetylmuramic acid 6-phosphate etherase [Bacteroidetes bacterium]|nr:MAG: N-acetylmuramic acid 6-phosphate etherase [Bacteroidota bacterium]
MSDPKLFSELQNLATEQKNPRSTHIDVASTAEILRIINEEDKLVAEAVGKELRYIEQATEIVVDAFRNGGRLFYVGAGTSGRLGILDASECPPTFGTPPEMVQGLIAGGPEAVFKAVEGAEDLESNGANAIKTAGVTSKDVVCGIAASSRTPYAIGATAAANVLGCKTIFITCVSRENFVIPVDVAICVVVGPEVVTGSTRMKSGTAQKLILNMLTTTAMVRLGKTYENMMIDLQMTNKKLIERSRGIVMAICDVTYDEAADLLEQARGHVKTALVMHLGEYSYNNALEALETSDGFVRIALGVSDQ